MVNYLLHSPGKYADVVELVDSLDLGSNAQACRFESCHPHQKREAVRPLFFGADDRARTLLNATRMSVAAEGSTEALLYSRPFPGGNAIRVLSSVYGMLAQFRFLCYIGHSHTKGVLCRAKKDLFSRLMDDPYLYLSPLQRLCQRK